MGIVIFITSIAKITSTNYYALEHIPKSNNSRVPKRTLKKFLYAKEH